MGRSAALRSSSFSFPISVCSLTAVGEVTPAFISLLLFFFWSAWLVLVNHLDERLHTKRECGEVTHDGDYECGIDASSRLECHCSREGGGGQQRLCKKRGLTRREKGRIKIERRCSTVLGRGI